MQGLDTQPLTPQRLPCYPVVVADYYGLEAIASRMGVSRETVAIWKDRYEFLMYPRRLPTKGTRSVWYTNDQLILAWERHRAVTSQRIRLPNRIRRNGVKDGPRRVTRASPALEPDLIDVTELDAVSTGT